MSVASDMTATKFNVPRRVAGVHLASST
ncbi:MAG: hypothetical protein QOG36_884, partial [Actinomycetota bacterium]|nr:hypothetical protein [Actinomycetota bacterium]